MIRIDFDKPVGKIKPMHAVGQPPVAGGFQRFDFTKFQKLTDAHIPYSRLHDVGGAFGGNRFVDVPNVFRDFDADENDPANYDFTFTDVLLKAMREYKLEPIYRLGVTIENQSSIKPYRIDPPKDPAKWARICEHIVRHYNEGWADGFEYGIKYWEIWNEPDNYMESPIWNQMWTGTREQYYELYDVSAKYLKKCFGDSIKVGGYASCGFYDILYAPEKYGMDSPGFPKRVDPEKYAKHESEYTFYIDFFTGFLKYIKEHGSPIDFFSWHSYGTAPETGAMADYVERVLEEYGFGGLETHLNEWNAAHTGRNMATSFASAQSAAMMIVLQNKKTDVLCYYDARCSGTVYGGLFNCYTQEPLCTYYSFLAFGKLYALGTQVECESDYPGVYVLAAKGENSRAVLIANTGKMKTVEIEGAEGMCVYLIDEKHHLEKAGLDPRSLTLKENMTVLLLSNEF